MNSLKKALICAMLFLAVVCFDYFTGYEVSSYPIYFLPIVLSFFYFGKWGGYLASAVATVLWMVADIASGHHLSNELFRYWNAASRFGIYSFFIFGLTIYTGTIATHRNRLNAIQNLMPICHGCGKILWKDGTWKTPQEILLLVSDDVPECPDCSLSEKNLGG